jgi:hypothetical protein
MTSCNRSNLQAIVISLMDRSTYVQEGSLLGGFEKVGGASHLPPDIYSCQVGDELKNFLLQVDLRSRQI